MTSPKTRLIQDEELIMDVISNALIDLILSDKKKYLIKGVKSNTLKAGNVTVK